jgi:hypothetical protein
MMAVQAADTGAENPISAARRVFIRHRRRTHPDTGRCTFCGGAWRTRGEAGRRVDGCAARQYAAELLGDQLDQLSEAVPLRPASPREA